jgi:hypothetical protein
MKTNGDVPFNLNTLHLYSPLSEGIKDPEIPSNSVELTTASSLFVHFSELRKACLDTLNPGT